MTLTARSQVMFLRKSIGTRLNVFAPINDLSSLSRSGSAGRALVPGRNNDVAIAGGQILGDEFSTHVIKVALKLHRAFSLLTRTNTAS